jgi:glycosyltransferase involved in cell wall biosynthesis
MKISVVIPTYEYNGKAVYMLEKSMGSLLEQTYKNFEIVVSDHSKDDTVYNYCKQFSIPVTYVRNEIGRGNSSINMNNGIRNSTGDIIKVLHMDDWMCSPNAFDLIVKETSKNPQLKWGGLGFNHYYEEKKTIGRYIFPHISGRIKTLLGCPSVSFFYNNTQDPIFFDENLIIINDSDMHSRLGKKYGNPILINEICVTIRIHENQVTNLVTEERHKNELEYYRNKHLL